MSKKVYKVPAYKIYVNRDEFYRGKRVLIVWRAGEPAVTVEAEDKKRRFRISANELRRRISEGDIVPREKLPKALSHKTLTWRVGNFLYSKLSKKLYRKAEAEREKLRKKFIIDLLASLGGVVFTIGYKLTQRGL